MWQEDNLVEAKNFYRAVTEKWPSKNLRQFKFAGDEISTISNRGPAI